MLTACVIVSRKTINVHVSSQRDTQARARGRGRGNVFRRKGVDTRPILLTQERSQDARLWSLADYCSTLLLESILGLARRLVLQIRITESCCLALYSPASRVLRTVNISFSKAERSISLAGNSQISVPVDDLYIRLKLTRSSRNSKRDPLLCLWSQTRSTFEASGYRERSLENHECPLAARLIALGEGLEWRHRHHPS